MVIAGKLLEITVEGSGTDRTAPDFDAWHLHVGAVADMLAAIDLQLHRKQMIVWKLADLHHSEPTICLRPEWTDTTVADDAPDAVVTVMFDAIGDVRRGVDPEALGSDAIDGFKRAIRPIGDLLRLAKLAYGDLKAQIDIELAAAMPKIRFRTESAREDWEGSLDEINVHGETPTFRLYPAVSRRFITCEVDADKIDSARGYLKRKVSVYGEAMYRPKERFPYRVKAESITPLDADDTEPLSGLSGSLSQAETEIMRITLAELRDGWER